jgi:hypothetical protein
MMIDGYAINDRFTMEHFPLHQSMLLTTSFFARDSIQGDIEMRDQILTTSYWLHVKLGKSI